MLRRSCDAAPRSRALFLVPAVVVAPLRPELPPTLAARIQRRRVHVHVRVPAANRRQNFRQLAATICWLAVAAVSTFAEVNVPVTVPACGHTGVIAATAAGAGVVAVWHSQTTMLPLTPGCAK